MNYNPVYVPIKINGLPVGDNESTNISCSAAKNFSQLGEVSLFPTDVSPAYFTPDTLKSGIHLHFELPEELLSGKRNPDGTVYFPELPNRWMITRMTQEVKASASFYIESDLVTCESTLYNKTPRTALPAFSYDTAKGDIIREGIDSDGNPTLLYTFIGDLRSEKMTAPTSASYLPSLTAVTSGDPIFTTYYPACSTVFGFFDPAEALSNETYSYVVTGWYSNHDNDLNAPYNTSVTPPNVKYIFHGAVCKIKWKGSAQNYSQLPKPDKISVSIGNNAAEALSAFAAKGDPETERIVCGFQHGILDLLSETHADGLLDFEEAIHARGFSTHIFDYSRRITNSSQAPLPHDTTAVLDHLNNCLSQYYASLALLEETQNRMFFSWYKYVLSNFDPFGKTYGTHADDYLQDAKNRLPDLIKINRDISAAKTAVDTAAQKLTLPGEAKLVAAPGKPYYLPNEPAFLIVGGGAYKSNQTVLRNKTITTLGAINGLAVDAAAIMKNIKPDYSSFPLPTDMDRFIYKVIAETLLMSGCFDDFITADILGMPLNSAVKQLQNARKNAVDPPAVFSLQAYGDEWQPMFAQWQFSLNAIRGNVEKDDTLSYFNFTDSDTDMKQCSGKPEKGFQLFQGMSALSSHAAENFIDTARSYVQNNPGGEYTGILNAAVSGLKDMTAVSFIADGFNERLIMRKPTLKSPLILPDNNANADFVRQTNVNIDYRNLYEPCIDEARRFMPFRAGMFDSDNIKIWLLDAFGRHIEIVPEPQTTGRKNKYTNPMIADLIFSEQLRDPGANALLPPRFMTPIRISLKITGICGYIIPDLLDRNLQIYTGMGNFAGILQQTADGHASWLMPKIQPNALPPALKNFVDAYLTDTKSNPHPKLSDLLDILEKRFSRDAHFSLNPIMTECFGQPLALTAATLSTNSKSPLTPCAPLRDISTDDNEFRDEIFSLFIGDDRRNSDSVAAYFVGEDYNSLNISGDPITLSLNDNSHNLTLLCETKGNIYVRSGLLPEFSVPFPTNEEVLKNFEIMLRTAPLLGNLNDLRTFTPAFGRQWSFDYNDTNGTRKIIDGIKTPDVLLPSADLSIFEGYLLTQYKTNEEKEEK